MRIKLTNFKCHEDRTFEFPDKGIVLLSARSGKGKSTLFDAISWVLYGNIRTTTTHGKTSCKVELWYKDAYVLRSRRPNRLSLTVEGKEYEDEDAQSRIHSLFGETPAYIKQDGSDTFTKLSPADKTKFIEDTIFSSIDIDTIKDRMKAEIKRIETKQVSIQSRLNALRETHPSQPTSRIRFPIKCEDDRHEEVILNERKKTDILKKKLEKIQTDIILAKDRRKKSDRLVSEIESKNYAIQVLKDQLPSEISFDSQRYTLLKSQISFIEQNREYSQLKSRLDMLQSERQERIREALKRVEENAVDEEELSSLEQYVSDYSKRTEMKTSIRKLKKALEGCDLERLEEQLGERLLCPSCSAAVTYNQDTKTLRACVNKDLESGIPKDELKKQIESIKKKINEKERLEGLLQELEESYDEWTDMSEHLSQLISTKKTCEDAKRTLKDLQSKTSSERKLEERLSNIRPVSEVREEDEELIRRELNELHSSLTIDLENKKKTVEIDRKIKILEGEIECMTREKETLHVSCDIEELELSAEEVRKKQDKNNKVLSLIDAWKVNCDQWETYLSYVRKVEDCQNEHAQIDLELQAAYLLRQKITEAESVSTSKFIASLNAHVDSYTSLFFKENDIMVRLDRVKSTVKGVSKPCLNVNITYKEMQDVDVGILSGGERDRVDLAFTLALSEMFQSKITMLDEVISSLDIETCNSVLESIRETYKGDLVLVVLHQANQGAFDEVIEI